MDGGTQASHDETIYGYAHRDILMARNTYTVIPLDTTNVASPWTAEQVFFGQGISSTRSPDCASRHRQKRNSAILPQECHLERFSSLKTHQRLANCHKLTQTNNIVQHLCRTFIQTWLIIVVTAIQNRSRGKYHLDVTSCHNTSSGQCKLLALYLWDFITTLAGHHCRLL